ncbi:MAG: ATP-binding cassette domain-containing protein, partial [Dehalococcoidia bacterium]|nr:ATP-binding cassette domain-containing protein [Dehalococcoidia bacterium]
FSSLTVLENLKLGAYIPRARPFFTESLERVFSLFPALKTRIDYKAGSLSGGEQQMLAIARGIMAQPKLLMLDEPSLGLSPILVKTIFELISALNEQKTTILLVEQNINQALKIAQQAYVLKTGKIVMTGRGDELLANEEIRKAYIGERVSKR